MNRRMENSDAFNPNAARNFDAKGANSTRSGKDLGSIENSGRAERFERYALENACPVNAHEEIDVYVPAYVRARAEIGNVNIRCMGSEIVKNTNEVHGRPGAVGRFVIRQKIRVDIPVVCAAEAYVGQAHIDFEGSTGDFMEANPFGEVNRCECETECVRQCEEDNLANAEI